MFGNKIFLLHLTIHIVKFTCPTCHAWSNQLLPLTISYISQTQLHVLNVLRVLKEGSIENHMFTTESHTRKSEIVYQSFSSIIVYIAHMV